MLTTPLGGGGTADGRAPAYLKTAGFTGRFRWVIKYPPEGD